MHGAQVTCLFYPTQPSLVSTEAWSLELGGRALESNWSHHIQVPILTEKTFFSFNIAMCINSIGIFKTKRNYSVFLNRMLLGTRETKSWCGVLLHVVGYLAVWGFISINAFPTQVIKTKMIPYICQWPL